MNVETVAVMVHSVNLENKVAALVALLLSKGIVTEDELNRTTELVEEDIAQQLAAES